MTVECISGMGPVSRDVSTVSYWKDECHRTVNASSETLADFLAVTAEKNLKWGWKYGNMKLTVTSKGNLYATWDTPGYCDGELTVSRTHLESLIQQ